VHQLFINLKKTHDLFRRELLYDILLEFGIKSKVVELIKICLNDTYSRVGIGKNLSEKCPCQNDLTQGEALTPLLFNSALAYALRITQGNQGGGGTEMEWDRSASGLC
jgi:hypothetical protein